MRYYKIGRGVYLEEKMDSLPNIIRKYFDKVDYKYKEDSSVYYIVDGYNVYDQIKIAVKQYDNKKNKIGIELVDKPVQEMIDNHSIEEARVTLNQVEKFLQDITERSSKKRSLHIYNN
jgi:hypothetical protein